MSSSKRKFFRSPVSAKTRVRLIEDAQLKHIRKRFNLQMILDSYMEADSSMAPLMNMVMDMFQHIDDKLERICEKLEQDEPRNRSLDVVDTVDISGSGVSLLVRECVEVGRMVHLCMWLTGSHCGTIEVLGRIVRIAPHEGSEEGVYVMGIEFVDLSEPEKDLLVKYTFSQQRKHIRTAGDT